MCHWPSLLNALVNQHSPARPIACHAMQCLASILSECIQHRIGLLLGWGITSTFHLVHTLDNPTAVLIASFISFTALTEFHNRNAQAKQPFSKLKNILTNNKLKISTRLRVLKCYVWPVLLHGCENLTSTKELLSTILTPKCSS